MAHRIPAYHPLYEIPVVSGDEGIVKARLALLPQDFIRPENLSELLSEKQGYCGRIAKIHASGAFRKDMGFDLGIHVYNPDILTENYNDLEQDAFTFKLPDGAFDIKFLSSKMPPIRFGLSSMIKFSLPNPERKHDPIRYVLGFQYTNRK